MLVSFAVENFRSFGEKQRFSMIANDTIDQLSDHLILKHWKNNEAFKEKLLPVAALYGPNAGGKSNFIRAIGALTRLIRYAIFMDIGEKIDRYDPFLLESNWQDKPTTFEIQFYAQNGVLFEYILSILRTKIAFEKLSYFEKGRARMLFLRNENSMVKFGEHYKGKRKIDCRENQAFLPIAARTTTNAELIAAYHFLTRGILFARQESEIISESIAKKMHKEKRFMQNVVSLLIASDIGIKDIQIKENEVDKTRFEFPEVFPEELKSMLIDNYRFELNSVHLDYENGIAKGTTTMPLEKTASTGTKWLLALAVPVFEVLENGGVCIIDEIEASLHPLLCHQLIRLFTDSEVNQMGAQLIFTTHNVQLLDIQAQLFRKDEVWFVEKTAQSMSALYSLDEVRGVREGYNWYKNYLSSLLGATPDVNDWKNAIEFVYKKKY